MELNGDPGRIPQPKDAAHPTRCDNQQHKRPQFPYRPGTSSSPRSRRTPHHLTTPVSSANPHTLFRCHYSSVLIVRTLDNHPAVAGFGLNPTLPPAGSALQPTAHTTLSRRSRAPAFAPTTVHLYAWRRRFWRRITRGRPRRRATLMIQRLIRMKGTGSREFFLS